MASGPLHAPTTPGNRKGTKASTRASGIDLDVDVSEYLPLRTLGQPRRQQFSIRAGAVGSPIREAWSRVVLFRCSSFVLGPQTFFIIFYLLHFLPAEESLNIRYRSDQTHNLHCLPTSYWSLNNPPRAKSTKDYLKRQGCRKPAIL